VGLPRPDAEELALLCPEWNQAEADPLAALVVARLQAVSWPEDAAARHRLGKLADAVDLAFEACDMERLRQSVGPFLAALDGGTKPLTVDGVQEWTVAADQPTE
jgi:hypothetical protein